MSRPSKTVLVVEDDPITREMYRKLLINEGYSVTAVEDGLDALRKIESQRPDLIVLDLILPRLGGLDVYNEIKANSATHDIPIVIATGSQVPVSIGLTPILRKPVSADALIATVAAALRGRLAQA